jgi:O-methyltransferase
MQYSKILYGFEDLSDLNYQNFRSDDTEDFHKFQMEHQIGRFNSIKKIMTLISEENIQGDILEFGCWQGHSIYNMLNILQRLKILEKRIVGIDGFIGIPEGYGHDNCKSGLFNDTSIELCISNINDQKINFPDLSEKFHVLRSLYSDHETMSRFLSKINVDKVCFIHMDCDVVRSCEEAMNFLDQHKLLNSKFFVHFDDWGIETGIPEWFYSFVNESFLSSYNMENLFETRLTKSFSFEK